MKVNTRSESRKLRTAETVPVHFRHYESPSRTLSAFSCCRTETWTTENDGSPEKVSIEKSVEGYGLTAESGTMDSGTVKRSL